LYSVEAEDTDKKDKVLSVHWNGEKILAGGEDKKLRIFKAKV
jgi:ribosome biogenesis protein YTM1